MSSNSREVVKMSSNAPRNEAPVEIELKVLISTDIIGRNELNESINR